MRVSCLAEILEVDGGDTVEMDGVLRCTIPRVLCDIDAVVNVDHIFSFKQSLRTRKRMVADSRGDARAWNPETGKGSMWERLDCTNGERPRVIL